MIPLLIPPLTGLQVLVTRPALQADGLCTRIAAMGGMALKFPVLNIEPCRSCPVTLDLLILSFNASAWQSVLSTRPQARRCGGLGRQTPAILGHSIDVAPDRAANGESLLAPFAESYPIFSCAVVAGANYATLSARQSGRWVTAIVALRRSLMLAACNTAAAANRGADHHHYQCGHSALASLLDADTLRTAKTRTLLVGSVRIAGPRVQPVGRVNASLPTVLKTPP
jgi:hypothetical protein